MDIVFSPYCPFFKLFLKTIAYSFTVLWLGLILYGCQSKQTKYHSGNQLISESSDHTPVQYAIGFDIVDAGDYRILKVNRQNDTIKYVLASDKALVPSSLTSAQFIKTPVNKIVLLHSSYLSFFKALNLEKSIIGISEEKYIYDSTFRVRIDQNQIPIVGFSDHLDIEMIITLKPQVVITVGFPNTPNKDFQQLESLGIPVIIFSDWQEKTLLGRTEWLKAVAVLFDHLEMADKIFNNRVQEYQQLVALAHSTKNKPSVICNLPFKGIWYMPGGDSYVANLLKDAGASYHWENNQNTGALSLDFEAVYPVGLNADFWINPGIATNTQSIITLDERLADFKSYRKNHIYNAIKRTRFGEANDYWESGLINPQIVLADVMHILHPGLLPDHALYYYEQLK